MKVLLAVLAVATSVARGLVRSYSVEPRTAGESGWTDTIRPYNYVSEVITCNWDELDSTSGGYVELFVGDLGANPDNAFQVNVYEVGGSVDPVASSPDTQAGDTSRIY